MILKKKPAQDPSKFSAASAPSASEGRGWNEPDCVFQLPYSGFVLVLSHSLYLCFGHRDSPNKDQKKSFLFQIGALSLHHFFYPPPNNKNINLLACVDISNKMKSRRGSPINCLPSPFYSSSMHRKLFRQNRNVCLCGTAYLPGPKKTPYFLRNCEI